MAIKTPKGYRVISGISKESLDAYIQSFTFGSGETILVGRSNTLDLTITRGTRTSDGAGNALQIQGGTATGTNQAGGIVRVITGYPTGNAGAGDFIVSGALVNGSSGTSVNPSNSTMFSVSGDTGDATFANDITIGGNEITNTGSDNDLILTSDKDMYFSIDKDEDTTNNKFVFRKGGSAHPFVEIAELDESGNLQIDGSLTIGSTEVINSSGVLQVATQGTIDHDSLANFVAAEHVDWAGASAGTIHSTNIPTLNQDTTGTATNATKQIVVTTHNFQMANTTGTFFYVPFNNLNESSAGGTSNYWTRTVPPYAGTIKKIAVRSHTSLGTSCELRISKITDTTDALTGGTHVDNTSIDISSANVSVIETMNTNSFAAGDAVGVALKRSAGTAARVVMTIAWEYTT